MTQLSCAQATGQAIMLRDMCSWIRLQFRKHPGSSRTLTVQLLKKLCIPDTIIIDNPPNDGQKASRHQCFNDNAWI